MKPVYIEEIEALLHPFVEQQKENDFIARKSLLRKYVYLALVIWVISELAYLTPSFLGTTFAISVYWVGGFALAVYVGICEDSFTGGEAVYVDDELFSKLAKVELRWEDRLDLASYLRLTGRGSVRLLDNWLSSMRLSEEERKLEQSAQREKEEFLSKPGVIEFLSGV